VAQVFWVLLAIVDLPIRETAVFGAALIGLEMSGPYIVERWKGGIPWNAGHIAERYGLLVIITLGEGIIGTVASINAVVHGPEGWSVDAGVVAFAGVGLTFAGGRTSRSRGPTSSGSTASARSSGATGTS
jgi:low temperature requirement protein LtrA